MPKIELHLHLEGAMRPETVRELSTERLGWNGQLPSGWENSYYTYTDFGGFMEQLTPRFPFRPDEYARIAAECFEDLAAQNVVYVEVSFDAVAREVGDDTRFWPIVEALETERQRAESRWPIHIGYIAAIMRTLSPQAGLYRAQLAIEARKRGIAIVGIDLHGDERLAPPEPFAPAFQIAGAAGLGLRAHAGEAAGTASICGAIDALGARRLAHGIQAVFDPKLMIRLESGDITLELCPTSNVRTASVPTLAAHPIRQFYDLGIPITVNSDDPLPFFTNMERECRLLVDEFGFTRPELGDLMKNAARASFQPEIERQRLVQLIERSYGAASHNNGSPHDQPEA